MKMVAFKFIAVTVILQVTLLTAFSCVSNGRESSVSSTITEKAQTGTEANRKALFADANLEKVVREALKKPQGQLYFSDLDVIQTLTIQGRVSSFSGLEQCHNLTTLVLNNNELSDLSDLATALTALPGLSVLYITGNQINDLSPLSELKQLTALELMDNRIRDISPLMRLTRLVSLGLNFNRVTDIRPLASLTGLKYLCLNGSPGSYIQNISPLSSLHLLNQLFQHLLFLLFRALNFSLLNEILWLLSDEA